MEAFDTAPVTEAAQRAFFDAMMECTRRAQQRVSAAVHYIELAGIAVRLNFAGPVLRDAFFPALSHLEISSTTQADAVFNIWDSASTGVDVPPPPCMRSQFTDRGDIWGFESEHILSAFHWMECSLALMNMETLDAIHWVDDAASLPYWSKASPLRTLLHWLTRRFGGQLLHAAVIGSDQGGIVITGKGGTGKSTTALLCLEAGMNYIGDDYVVIRLDPEPRAYSLYSTAKLNPDQAARFPKLGASQVMFAGSANAAAAAIPDKAVFQLHPEWRGQMPKSLKLTGIVMPAISPQDDTDFAAVDPATLLRSASFTTLSQLPRAGQASHEFMARLCRILPRFTLRLGRDFDKIPGAVLDFIKNPPVATAPPAATLSHPPSVSVIIPVHNGLRFLNDAIGSILAQQYPVLDIVIIDDGSTEDVVAAVEKLPVDVRLFRQDNAGPAAARNRGIREGIGDYLAFLDIDDQWPTDNLKRLLDILIADQEADVVIGHGQLIRQNAAQGTMDYIGNPAESFPFAIGAALFRRRAFAEVGFFDPALRFGEDTDWFRRAEEKRLTVRRITETTLLVRRHDTNMTRGKTLVELNALKVFKKLLDRQRQAS